MSNIEELVKDVLLNDISAELVNRIAKALDINYHLTSTYELSVDVEDILSTDRNADSSKSGFYIQLLGTRSGVNFFYNNNLEITRKPDNRKTRVVQRWNNLKGFSESFWHKWANKWLDSSNMNLEEGLMELTQKQAEKIVDAIKADDRHDPAQFQKLFDNKHLWFGEFDGDRCTALVSVRKDDLGLNDYYINEFQSFEKGAGKKLLNQLIDMYNTLWLMSDPEATDSLKDYYRQFGLNEFVLNNNIYNRPVSFFYNKGLDSEKFKRAVSYYYGNETYDHDPLIEKIVKKSDGYYVTSEDGKKNLGGPYKKKEDAEKRLGQVEFFKSLKESDDIDDLDTVFSNLKRIEFYDLDGSNPVQDFILAQDDVKLQAKIMFDLKRLDDLGNKARKPLSDYVDDGILEMRTKQGSNISRVFYFFIFGDKIVMTNGYVKKTQKLDPKEFKLAKKRRDKYMKEKVGGNK